MFNFSRKDTEFFDLFVDNAKYFHLGAVLLDDVITDYTYRDKIKIKGSYSTLSSGDDVVIKVGSGRITVKNAIDEDLNISRVSNFEERWFMENEESGNVALGNDELDSILEDKVDIAIDYKFNAETQSKVFDKSIPLTHNKK